MLFLMLYAFARVVYIAAIFVVDSLSSALSSPPDEEREPVDEVMLRLEAGEHEGCMKMLQDMERKAKKKLRVLELFSGTGSVGRAFEARGWEVVSVDITDRFLKPTHLANILEWDYKQYPSDHFDFVWASPPCATFSCLQYAWLGRQRNGETFTKETMLKNQQKIGVPCLRKAQEIIAYFNPTHWVIENPRGGMMKNYLQDIPFVDVSYCQYGYDYQKHTRFWTNIQGWVPKKCGKHCPLWRKHKGLPNSLKNRYSIPSRLIEELIAHINK